jgi:Sulfotransferase family
LSDAPILIVGCPRSGTTLLRDLLRSHSRLTFPLESRVIPALYRSHGDPGSDARARSAAADLLRSWDIATWRLELTPEQLQHHRSFAALVQDLYESWARREGKPRWGDKTPLYVLELDTLLALFPHAQVINIVRDGRDVALSMMRQPWGPTNPYTAAIMWRRSVDAGLRAAARLPPSTLLQVRYEDLLIDPERELRRICSFLGERYEPAMLRPSRLRTPSGRPNPWPAHLESQLDRGNGSRWRTEMTSEARGVFEAVAGEQLLMAAYPLTGQRTRLPLYAKARWRVKDASGWLRWRATTWDRIPRARTTWILARAWSAGVFRR